MSDTTLTPRPARPRVLAVTSEPPWPLHSGGHIRSFHLLSALAAETDLLVVCPLQPHQQDAVDTLREHGLSLACPIVGSRTKLGEARRLLGALIRRQPYVMYRRHGWPNLRTVIEAEAVRHRPDVLYLDHLDSLQYRALAARVPAVMDLHNVYSLLVRRTADEQTSPLKRAFLRREAGLLDRMEWRAARECAALFAVSQPEAEHFRSLGAKAVHVIPNGVDCAAIAGLPHGRRGPPTVLFLGTMSWGPNASAARFLIEILPKLRDRVQGATVLVVGRDPPADLLAMNGRPGVEVTGGVPDVKPYLLRASVMAVPLDAGGGTRLKILEAFAAGLPVVSTAVGAEGIDATPGRHLVIAERPAFAEALAGVLLSSDGGDSLAVAGRNLAREVYDWARIGRKAAAVVKAVAGG